MRCNVDEGKGVSYNNVIEGQFMSTVIQITIALTESNRMEVEGKMTCATKRIVRCLFYSNQMDRGFCLLAHHS